MIYGAAGGLVIIRKAGKCLCISTAKTGDFCWFLSIVRGGEWLSGSVDTVRWWVLLVITLT